MAVEPTFATPTDYFSLADDDTVVLIDSGGGLRRAWIEVVKSTGEFLDNDYSPKDHDLKYEYSATYRLLSGSVSVILGGIMNTDYLVTGFNVNQNNKDYPQLSINGVKYSAASLITENAATVSITCGFGVVDVFGHTGQGTSWEAIAATMAGSGNLVECWDHDGDILKAKLIQHRLDVTLEVLGTLPDLATGYNEISQDSKKSNEGWQTNSRNAFTYPTLD